MVEVNLHRLGWAALCALASSGSVSAQTVLNQDLASLTLANAVTVQGTPRGLSQPAGTATVAVRLADAPLLQKLGENARKSGTSMTVAQRRAYVDALRVKQDAVLQQVRALGGQPVARLTTAGNMLVVTIDEARLPQVASISGVAEVRNVPDYSRDLETTVPYVGGETLHGLGLTGAGVKVAVLDSGIDYTHYELGGSGAAADFAAAAASAAGVAPAGLFPSAKVIGGYDFVGENWPNTAVLAPDPNPIDAGSAAGHGTHVADIIAGRRGMAPGASLYAVKICSSVSTSCSGVAILNGLEWVADPNGDLDFSDSPDVVNMSLGAAYGQRENPANALISNLVRFGMVFAISAGNNGDRPYILGGPSNTAEAISVAQTSMPLAVGYALSVTAPPAIAGTYNNTATVDWAPITTGFSGALRRAAVSGSAAAQACTLADTIDFTGFVALIERGICSVSIKVANAAAKGAIGVIIANNVAGDAPTFSYGGGTPLVQTLVVTQGIGNTLRSVPTDTAQVAVGTSTAVGLGGSMAATSSRGPIYNFSGIKPEIGAPGASLSAEFGTGTGRTTFGGTSGAAPMVAGAAALLIEKYPTAMPVEIKARLMNSAETAILTNPMTTPGELAPITRIGGGELRVDRAADLTTTVWDAANPHSVGIGFGSVRAIGIQTLSRKIAVRNHSNTARVYAISSGFRYANDQASGAVTMLHPATVSVPANSTTAFVLQMRLDASKLPAWNLSGASNQGNGALLQGVEFDGYLTVAGAGDTATVPWHVIPHKAANVASSTPTINLGGNLTGNVNISNTGGAVSGPMEVFALTGTSPQISPFQLPYGGGVVLTDLKAAGVRPVDVGGGALGIQFAVATYGERAHPAYPAEFDIYIDSDANGTDDYVVYNIENGAFGSNGQTVVYAYNLTTNTQVARFYINADLNSSNAILTVLASDVGITSAAQKFRFTVLAFDNRVSGLLVDSMATMTHTLATPRFTSTVGNSLGVPIGFSGSLPVARDPAGDAASPSQSGLLLMHSHARSGRESDSITINP